MTKKGSDKAGQIPIVRPETATPAPTEWRPRYADAASCRKITEKIFKTHENLFRRLAEYERNERR
jgi:hypothetical protein